MLLMDGVVENQGVLSCRRGTEEVRATNEGPFVAARRAQNQKTGLASAIRYLPVLSNIIASFMTKANGEERSSRQAAPAPPPSIAFPIVISKTKSSATTTAPAATATASSPSRPGSSYGTPPSTSASTLLSHHLTLDERPRTLSGGSTSSLAESSSPRPRKHRGPPSLLLKPRSRPTSATSFEVDFSGIQTPRRQRDGEGSSTRSSSLTRAGPSQSSPPRQSTAATPHEALRRTARREQAATKEPTPDACNDADDAPPPHHLTPLQKQIRSDGQRISSFLDGSSDDDDGLPLRGRTRWSIKVNISLSICRPYVALLQWSRGSRAWLLAQTDVVVPLPVAQGGWVEWGVAKLLGGGGRQRDGDAEDAKARKKR